MPRSKFKRRYHAGADAIGLQENSHIPDATMLVQRKKLPHYEGSDNVGDTSVGSSFGASRQAETPKTRGSQSSLPGERGGNLPRATSSHLGGHKRKAVGPSADSRPAQKARIMHQQQYTRAEMMTMSLLPTPAQYGKSVPKILFDPNPLVAINDGLKSLNLKFKKTTRNRAGQVECTLTAEGANGYRDTAEAKGNRTSDAVKAAYLQMLSQMHTSGFLKSVINPTDVDKLDSQTLANEADAKSEVYNYSARYGLVPNFETHRTERPSLGKSQTTLEVKIELPAQDISVSATGMDIRSAEIAAAVRFKKAAEQYHARQGTGATVIQGPVMLHTGNAKLFFDYYRLFKSHDNFELQTSQISGISSGRGRKRGGKAEQGWRAQMMREQSVKLASSKKSFMDLLEPEKVEKTQIPITSPVTMLSRKAAEEVAQLAAAVVLTKEDPALLEGFRKSMSSSGKAILNPLRPVYLKIDEDAESMMEDTLRDARRAGLADEREQLMADEKLRESRRTRAVLRPLTDEEAAAKSERLNNQQELFNKDPSLQELREKKALLPMSQYREKVLELVDGHLYSVIVGATGSGKTTQVPQIVLEDAIYKGQGANCNVICTQPRRIAATSVARRVADERNERIQNSVGYHVRFDPKRPRQGGSITYCTTGILLQQLQNDPDEIFDSTSHIIIDEVHERDILIDFLMIILKNAVKVRSAAGKSVPRVVLMSATIDSELFANYFETKTADGQIVACPSLSVPGRTFPVKEKYLDTILRELGDDGPAMSPGGAWMQSDPDSKEYLNVERNFRPSVVRQGGDAEDDTEMAIDWKLERRIGADGQVSNEKEDALVPLNLIAATVAHICKKNDDGAILVFLPGLEEMKKVAEILRGNNTGRIRGPAANFGVNFKDSTKHKIIMLHSSVPADEQAMAFDPVPPGCRKVILSTNIAETSVTIPDVQFVVDTGKLREKRYDQIRRITQLQCTWISKSNAKQRAGRAGRVQNGNYYALFSKPRFDSLRAIGLPEMLRSDLQEICLDIKAQSLEAPIREFLSQSIEPPAPAAVDASVQNLQSLQAITEEEDLTALGRLLAQLPVHPSLGKMIVLGVIFRCLDPIIIIGATLSERSLFTSPPDRRREAQDCQARFGEGTGSDHYALLNAFTQMRIIRESKGQPAMMDFAYQNFLHPGAFKTIHATTLQIEEVLVDAGLIPRVFHNERFEHECGPPAFNTNAANVALIKALTLAGLHPNLALATSSKLLRTPGEKNALVHPSSLNHVRETVLRQQARARDTAESRGVLPAAGSEETLGIPPFSLVSYTTMVRSNDGKSTFLRDVTVSSELMAVLFGGKLKRRGNTLEMDSWLPFELYGGPRTGSVLIEFRKAMDRMLTRAFRGLSGTRGKGASATSGDASASAGLLGSKGPKNDDFADDEVRRIFAEGLVEVLNLDSNRKSKGRFGGDKSKREIDRGGDPLRGSKGSNKGRGVDGNAYKRQVSNDDDWIFGGKGAGFGQKGEYAFGGKW